MSTAIPPYSGVPLWWSCNSNLMWICGELPVKIEVSIDLLLNWLPPYDL